MKTFGLCWALERSKGCAGWPGGGGRWFRSGLEKRKCLSNPPCWTNVDRVIEYMSMTYLLETGYLPTKNVKICKGVHNQIISCAQGNVMASLELHANEL